MKDPQAAAGHACIGAPATTGEGVSSGGRTSIRPVPPSQQLFRFSSL